ncbi:unnamed protein product [Cylindrotheca closterium]|uniref:Rieske domain-containing protein n=1 Tax=Cylindrotheca closterium TaxID=2856 RepID=A0AAD2FJB6_9STRA|nr:unnamed protein product [Cylindrotheca closterium]
MVKILTRVLTASLPSVGAFVSPLGSRSANKIINDVSRRTKVPVQAVDAEAKDTFAAGSSKGSFANFDYEAHWYPVSWARDLQVNDPTKVTVFDVDYVVSKTANGEIICMEDKCAHKGAALSQGRVTGNGKNFQCAYHGWSFDGKSGECTEIPQLVQADGSSTQIPSRACGTAVPAQIQQEMVWIFPGGGLEKALQAPSPPLVQEVETGGFKLGQFVRDFPVDWPIVVSNIFDPDHGLFAHQATTFDMYSASSMYPLEIQNNYPDDGKGWVLESKVQAQDKLLDVNAKLREAQGESKKKEKKKDEKELWASSYFQAPFHLQLKRVDPETGSTNFVSTFYICPVGVGRTRFMAAQGSKTATPRWLTKLFTDNFLDQDTYLLATQQKNILTAEAKEVEELLKTVSSAEELKSVSMKTRKKMFCLTSPTEKVGARLENFWDDTLLRVPNRIQRLLQLNAVGAFATTPPREVVLDRKSQQYDISNDSKDVVKNCQKVSKYSKLAAVASIALRFTNKAPKALTSPTATIATLGLCFLVSSIAQKLEREYYFKYTDDYRRKDLAKIPKKIWIDKEYIEGDHRDCIPFTNYSD